MRDITGNLWTTPADWRGITTNGYVKRDGRCVMGRGCAREARDRFPGFDLKVGTHITRYGNIVGFFIKERLFTFPVKHVWSEPADLDLIAQSTAQLATIARNQHDWTYVLPRPGCGNGGLTYATVRPLLLKLPDNVSIITF